MENFKIDKEHCIFCGAELEEDEEFMCSECKHRNSDEIRKMLEERRITDKLFWILMCMHLLGADFNNKE